ncbi:MAG: glycosyltransferase family 4 protein [Planctomycetota bacterium]
MTPALPHLVHLFSTFDPGGPQVRTARLIALLGGDYRHTIVAMDGRCGCAKLLPSSAPASCVEPPPGYRRSRLFALRLVRLLRELQPDLILTYNWGAIDAVLAAALLRFRPAMHHEDGFGPDEAFEQKRRRILVRRLLLRRVQAVFVPSRTLEEIATRIWKLETGRVHLIQNGIDTDRFSPGDRRAARRELGLPEDCLLIGTVGHLREVKDQALLVDAFAAARRTDRARLIIVGEGAERDSLEALARARGIREQVTFTGWIDDLVPLYRSLDLFALSSRTEQMPLALLEAMSSGLPVISTAVGDIPSILRDEEQLCAEGDPRAFVELLEAALGDPGLRARLGQQNRELCIEDFSEDEMLRRFRGLYDALLGRDV